MSVTIRNLDAAAYAVVRDCLNFFPDLYFTARKEDTEDMMQEAKVALWEAAQRSDEFCDVYRHACRAVEVRRRASKEAAHEPLSSPLTLALT